ncbi:MAG TPA: type II secretion system protein [Micavibrio sp.]|nr:type II secretion system protein [Micavibrio sp.]
MRGAVNNERKKMTKKAGFTLVEMAMVLVIIGLVVAPAVGLYNLYSAQQREDKTIMAMNAAWNAIDGFRSMYGRYPCPAPFDAIRTSSAYGHEALDGAGNCDDSLSGITSSVSFRSALPPTDNEIFVGSIPFRQMNLREDLIVDGYGARLTYAVTGIQTDDTTYEANNGGITIQDAVGTQLTQTPDSAHVVIISHGKRNAGAVNLAGQFVGGALACAGLAAEETENCDMDQTFVEDQTSTTFDDLVYFGTADDVGQWQVSAASDMDIHLRRSTSITMGIDESDPTVGFSSADIRRIGVDGAIVKATTDVSLASTGRFVTSLICDETGTECFPPNLIAGQIAAGEGMACPPATPYMTGIQNGTPICTDEITFECPDPDDFIVGVGANGEIICDTVPPAACPDQTLTGSCGDDRLVSGFWNSGTMYGYAYSGECYNIEPLDTAFLDAQTDLDDIRDYIDALNAAPRTAADCGPTINEAQVRDTFRCESGAWNTTPIRTIERWQNNPHSLGHGPTSGGDTADFGGPAYNPVAPMSTDPNNNNASHDCWCREDYRVDTTSCSGASTGLRFRIREHRCPSTRQGHWQNSAYGGWDDRFCGCTPSSDTRVESCASHFGYSGPGIAGNVTIPYDITCPSGPSGSPVIVDGTPDLSDCRCPSQPGSPGYSTTACDFGYTNSYSWDGQSFTNAEHVDKWEWVCPGGPAPVQPVSSAADAGSWQWVDDHDEACVCDGSVPPLPETVPCPAGQQGTGTHYLRPWDCDTGTYEPAGPSNQVGAPDCHTCVWQLGTGPRIETYAAPQRGLNACSSCSGTGSCWLPGDSAGEYKIFDGCYCAGQP